MDDKYINLLNILDEEIEVYKKLLNIISSEYNYFVARDYDNIHNHIDLKESFYQKLIDLEAKREKSIDQIRVTLQGKKIESLTDLIDCVNNTSVKENLSLRRTTLKLLIDRIFEANERSKIFLEKSRSVFNDVMGNIKKLANASRKNVYGNKGKLDEHNDTQTPLLLNKEA